MARKPRTARTARTATASSADLPPSSHDWRTSDSDEVRRRRARAAEESFTIEPRDARHPVCANFRVGSGSGLVYEVEVRDVHARHFACTCVDFRINGLGTCKHIEAVLLHLERRLGRDGLAASTDRRPEIHLSADRATLQFTRPDPSSLGALAAHFDASGILLPSSIPEEVVTQAAAMAAEADNDLRLSLEVAPWLEQRRRAAERLRLRREYEARVQSGEWPPHETKMPLFPYQREGMLHLAFAERALLADEMGLGKTIQAIAACALLQRLGLARRVLVVTPASLKTEWEEQIRRFTDLSLRIVYGGRSARLAAYAREGAAFFTVVNYEQMRGDALEVVARLAPEVVVLDEAQRIKNWGAKTTQAVKRLSSRYAFVLTGTPIENRIDELYSLMDYIDPTALGPLFRFNRAYYTFDDRGRPDGYRNLAHLHERIAPYLLRRRKTDVEKELPDRADENRFVPLSPEQAVRYRDHEATVARLVATARRRPLTQAEQDKLMRELAMMRMLCDTAHILEPKLRACPKLDEAMKIVDDCAANEAKVIIFSEWERMLELIRDRCRAAGIGHAWHTGSVPQLRRRTEINTFKQDPACRVFLSTDAGATGLNLQCASVVVNCDLPWNPAKHEQRIARAWRKHQTRAVTVINLVAENTIEHRMLDTLAHKQALATGVLDSLGNLENIPLRRGAQSFLKRLETLTPPPSAAAHPIPPTPPAPDAAALALPSDRPLGFAQIAHKRLAESLVSCEERSRTDGEPATVLYVVVEKNASELRSTLQALHEEYFGAGRWDPLCPVQLEVVDRATHEAIERLAAAGLLQLSTQGRRLLHPQATASSIEAPPLSAAQLARQKELLAHAEKKLRLVRLLGGAGMEEELLRPLLDLALARLRLAAIARGECEPEALAPAMQSPLATTLGAALPELRRWLAVDSGQAPADTLAPGAWRTLADALA